MKLAVIAAAAVLTVVAIPTALAHPTHWRSSNVKSVNVYTGDLNLADPEDRDEAAYRIHVATDAACKPFPDVRVFQEVHDWRDCRAEAFDEAMAELGEKAAHHHRRGHVTTREYQGEPPPPPPEDDEE